MCNISFYTVCTSLLIFITPTILHAQYTVRNSVLYSVQLPYIHSYTLFAQFCDSNLPDSDPFLIQTADVTCQSLGTTTNKGPICRWVGPSWLRQPPGCRDVTCNYLVINSPQPHRVLWPRKQHLRDLGSCDRASWAKYEERRPTRCNS